jgi:hypothetical protein
LNKVYVGFICNPIYRAEVDTNVTNMTVGENHKERINREIYATAQRAMDREPHGQLLSEMGARRSGDAGGLGSGTHIFLKQTGILRQSTGTTEPQYSPSDYH